MKTETLLRILAGLLCAGNAGAESPLEFREYTQTVHLEFLSLREAQQAQLLANPLPRNYKLAVSARWDDSAWEHLRTLEHMKKYGLKGRVFHRASYGHPSAFTLRGFRLPFPRIHAESDHA